MEQVGLEAVFVDQNFQRGAQKYMKTAQKVEKQTEQTAKAASAFSGTLGKTGKSVDDVRARMDAHANLMRQKYAKEFERIENQAQNLDKAMKVIGAGLTAAGAASGVFIGSSVQLAARVETLGVVTENLGENVGMTVKEMRALEEAVMSQGITLQKSRQSIALMVQAQIDLSHATDLARLAQDAAVIAGVDSSEAFEKLITTITMGSTRIGRTLGLQLSFNNAYKVFAEEIGKTVPELDEMERVQARTNEVMRAGAMITGTYEAAMETAGKKVLSLNRHIEESRRIIGEAYLPIYADLVDTVTNALKAFEDMEVGQQRAIASAMGMATVWTSLTGAGILLLTQLENIKTGIYAVNTAMGGSAAVMGGAIALLAALSTGAYASAQAYKAIAEEVKAAHDEILYSAPTYEDYIADLKKLAEAEGKILITEEELEQMREGSIRSWVNLADTMVVASKQTWEFRNAQEAATDMVHQSHMAISDVYDERSEEVSLLEEQRRQLEATREARREEKEMIDEQVMSEEELQRVREEIAEQMDTLSLQMRTDLTGDFEAVREQVEQLTNRSKELKVKIGELEGQDYLTEAQKEQLNEYREELGEIPGAIDEVRDAWDLQTKNMIFNLAQQRLMIDGLTTDEMNALAKLAGPEGFGLLDQASVDLIGFIGGAADKMDEATESGEDFSDAFVEAMIEAQEEIGSTEDDIDDLDMAISDLENRTITISGEVFWTLGDIPASNLIELGDSDYIPEATGGRLGGINLVGEKGPELIIDDVVIPAGMTADLLKIMSPKAGHDRIDNVADAMRMLKIQEARPVARAGGGPLEGAPDDLAILLEMLGGVPTERRGGGRLTGLDVIGEEGPELVIGNMVIPHELTRMLLPVIGSRSDSKRLQKADAPVWAKESAAEKSPLMIVQTKEGPRLMQVGPVPADRKTERRVEQIKNITNERSAMSEIARQVAIPTVVSQPVSPAAPVERQYGGPLTGFDLLGEGGSPELVFGDTVFPADLSRSMINALVSRDVGVPSAEGAGGEAYQVLGMLRDALATRQSDAEVLRSSMSPAPIIQTQAPQYNETYKLEVHTRATSEPIVGDFRMMAAMAGRKI